MVGMVRDGSSDGIGIGGVGIGGGIGGCIGGGGGCRQAAIVLVGGLAMRVWVVGPSLPLSLPLHRLHTLTHTHYFHFAHLMGVVRRSRVLLLEQRRLVARNGRVEASLIVHAALNSMPPVAESLLLLT